MVIILLVVTSGSFYVGLMTLKNMYVDITNICFEVPWKAVGF